ncbi:MAG: hypothetical protein WD396_01230, partial [Pseudohongiellaceae bacterium]
MKAPRWFRSARLVALAAPLLLLTALPARAQVTMTEAAQCEALLDLRNLTITRAGIRSNPQD